jgi:hypothetical protein
MFMKKIKYKFTTTRQLKKYILQDKKQHINYYFLRANFCLYLAENIMKIILNVSLETALIFNS